MRRDVGIRRREALSAIGGAVLGGISGCLGDSMSLTVIAAGSLAKTIDAHVGPAFEEETGISVHGEYYGTNALIRLIEDETKHPDVVISADNQLLRDRLYPEYTDWDVEFASNRVGLGYGPDTSFGESLAGGEPWYTIALESDEGDLSIGDPDLDPLGYRAIQAFQLAEEEYGLDNFESRILERVAIEPDEPQMMASVAAGNRAASIVYRNMAIDHDMPFHEFSPLYNFSDPALNDHYSTASYTTDEESYTAIGRAIVYNTTVLGDADEPAHGYEFIQYTIDNPGLLEDAGLTVPSTLPLGYGDVPNEVSV